jgi:hypothetical protein
MRFAIPSHSTVAAYAALFLAVGTGGAYAASELTANSVGAAQIRTSAVRSGEIRNGSVGLRDLSPTVRNLVNGGGITHARIAQAVTDVITDPTLGLTIKVQGEKGEKGDTGIGAPGATGPQGTPGIAAVTTREAIQPVDTPAGSSGGVTARCLPGEHIVGGGGSFVAPTQTGAVQTSSAPLDGGEQGWTAVYANTGPGAGKVHAFAICAQLG